MFCAITIGEIEGFFLRKNYGAPQTERWNRLLEKAIILNIDGKDKRLMKAYAEIQAYCQNNHPTLKPGKSNTIGQNDRWIAAIAHVTNSTLFTKDPDFNHIKGNFIHLVKVEKERPIGRIIGGDTPWLSVVDFGNRQKKSKILRKLLPKKSLLKSSLP